MMEGGGWGVGGLVSGRENAGEGKGGGGGGG